MRKNSYNLVYVILFVSIVALGYYFQSVIDDNIEDKRKKELEIYKEIGDQRKDINGVVILRTFSQVCNGTLLVHLNNGDQFALSSLTYNNNYAERCLKRFIQIGDSISKLTNSDSIYIYRKDKTYYFIVGKDIN